MAAKTALERGMLLVTSVVKKRRLQRLYRGFTALRWFGLDGPAAGAHAKGQVSWVLPAATLAVVRSLTCRSCRCSTHRAWVSWRPWTTLALPSSQSLCACTKPGATT